MLPPRVHICRKLQLGAELNLNLGTPRSGVGIPTSDLPVAPNSVPMTFVTCHYCERALGPQLPLVWSLLTLPPSLASFITYFAIRVFHPDSKLMPVTPSLVMRPAVLFLAEWLQRRTPMTFYQPPISSPLAKKIAATNLL